MPREHPPPPAGKRRQFERRKRGKPIVSIVGAGRLGTALGCALAACDYPVAAVVNRRRHHAERARALINPHPRALLATQLDQLPPSDLLLITTPDDHIAETALRLAASLRGSSPNAASRKARVALHTSGALSSEELAALRDTGFAVGSMHPLISVSDSLVGAQSLREAFYCIEGEAKAVRLAEQLVRDLGGHSFTITAGHKALYHVAAVTASGHAVALFDFAAQLLRRCGLNERESRRVLLPLLLSTLQNLFVRSPTRALTGPFARADAATVRQHLAALRAESRTPAIEDALELYTLLGRRSLQLAKQARVGNTDRLREVALLLEEARGGSPKKRGKPGRQSLFRSSHKKARRNTKRSKRLVSTLCLLCFFVAPLLSTSELLRQSLMVARAARRSALACA